MIPSTEKLVGPGEAWFGSITLGKTEKTGHKGADMIEPATIDSCSFVDMASGGAFGKGPH